MSYEKRVRHGRCGTCGKQCLGRSKCVECVEKAKARRDKAREAGVCTRCCAKPALSEKRLCETCVQKKRDGNRAYNLRLKLEVMNAYGGPICACCGENEIEFLSMDHIEGGGKAHMKEIKMPIYQWLRNERYPSGFQVLCMNCNFAKGKLGYCPHQRLGTKRISNGLV